MKTSIILTKYDKNGNVLQTITAKAYPFFFEDNPQYFKNTNSNQYTDITFNGKNERVQGTQLSNTSVYGMNKVVVFLNKINDVDNGFLIDVNSSTLSSNTDNRVICMQRWDYNPQIINPDPEVRKEQYYVGPKSKVKTSGDANMQLLTIPHCSIPTITTTNIEVKPTGKDMVINHILLLNSSSYRDSNQYDLRSSKNDAPFARIDLDEPLLIGRDDYLSGSVRCTDLYSWDFAHPKEVTAIHEGEVIRGWQIPYISGNSTQTLDAINNSIDVSKHTRIFGQTDSNGRNFGFYRYAGKSRYGVPNITSKYATGYQSINGLIIDGVTVSSDHTNALVEELKQNGFTNLDKIYIRFGTHAGSYEFDKTIPVSTNEPFRILALPESIHFAKNSDRYNSYSISMGVMTIYEKNIDKSALNTMVVSYRLEDQPEDHSVDITFD